MALFITFILRVNAENNTSLYDYQTFDTLFENNTSLYDYQTFAHYSKEIKVHTMLYLRF
jgi:hypothetical protein